MTKVAIIGMGNWGSKVHSCLQKLPVNIVQPEESDWVFLCTPNDLHYEQTLHWLKQGKNVFCEKPATLSHQSLKTLYSYADSVNRKLYVDDVFAWRHDILIEEEYNSFHWSKPDTTSYLERLAYHHFYLWSRKQPELNIEAIHGGDGHLFIALDNGNSADFYYSKGKVSHKVNEIPVDVYYRENPLLTMLQFIVTGNANYAKNRKNTLNATMLLEKARKVCYKKALVIGAGVFGATSAIALSNNGYQVDLMERSDSILSCASSINQYRLHKGYHYPRSKDTAQECLDGIKLFEKKYESAVVNKNIEHFYGIASEDSLVSAEDYKTFLGDMSLEYEEVDCLSGCDLTIRAEENLFDPSALYNSIQHKLYGSNVDLYLNTEVTDLAECKKEYDVVVVATYARLNELLSNKKDYQFELCEKPVVKLPEQFTDKSIVIMDGPFMCLDPLGDYFVLGNVVHAVHETYVGEEPHYDEKWNDYLNKGIVENPKITNIDKFIETGKKYFGEEFGELEHVGSMYTIRTVLKDRDHDDARPTLVNHEEDNVWSLFSGKIDTCVSASNELIRMINDV